MNLSPSADSLDSPLAWDNFALLLISIAILY